MNLTDTQIRKIVDELADEVVNRLLQLEEDGMVDPVLNPPLPNKVFIDGEWVDRVPGEQYAQDSAYAAAGNAAIGSAIAAEGPRNDPQRSENNPERLVNKPETADCSVLTARQVFDEERAAKYQRREAEALEAGMRRVRTMLDAEQPVADSIDSSPSVVHGNPTEGERAAHAGVGGTAKDTFQIHTTDLKQALRGVNRAIDSKSPVQYARRTYVDDRGFWSGFRSVFRHADMWGLFTGALLAAAVGVGVFAFIVWVVAS